MQDKITTLVERLLTKTQAGSLAWYPEQPMSLTGDVALRTSLKSHELRLSTYKGLQVYHWGQWEAICEDEAVLERLLGATGLKVSPDEELSALIEDIIKAH